jgi:hypothetical protein|tara:strand:+ start:465 stop:845 length:381 start_codon:yes stop_codon:yes gene_type:complete
MFDLFKKKKPEKKEAPKKAKKSDKEIATEKKEPWVNVLTVELDPDDPGNGAFELDWNDYFVAKLVKSGYQQKKEDTDAIIVDRWFQSVCKNVIAENYEQWEANQSQDGRARQNNQTDLGDGRTEIS